MNLNYVVKASISYEHDKHLLVNTTPSIFDIFKQELKFLEKIRKEIYLFRFDIS